MLRRISMWSGPRNISTTMMRSFESRGDTYVSDEPMYGHFLNNTNIKHPFKEEIILSMETNRNKLREYLCNYNPEGFVIWYQKQMSHHILDDDNLNWIGKFNNIFLIRHPKNVILSYIKKYKLKDEHLIGYVQLKRIFDFVKQNLNSNPLVIDSDDILSNPKLYLERLCLLLNIPFTKKMLSWEKGYRKTDGIWAKHWYNKVINTNSFKPLLKNNKILPKEYSHIYNNSMDVYNEIYQYKLKI